ncbi:hypothetical protein GGR54DRAFT_608602 [Hypoxylon sp. NC1633]|nr:hypothetical protein GGR54DRAFT_608602 [Hypoxylon sp. NC1633]
MSTIFNPPGFNPPNPFSTPIQAFLSSGNLSSAPAPEETAAHIITIVSNSPDPTYALWQLWDAFFIAAFTCSITHHAHITLLGAIRAQPPTQLKHVPSKLNPALLLGSGTQAARKLNWSALPYFRSQWRDVHDVLQAWRDWGGARAPREGDNPGPTVSSLCSSVDKYFQRFCVFSAAQLKADRGKGQISPIWVFFACRDALEREGPGPGEPRAHRMSPEHVWALDVRVAATWLRDGGRVLWETDYEESRRSWAAALNDKTELWQREDGLTRDRWRLWEERLRALSLEGGKLDEETRSLLTEAAGVVEGILRESSA